MLDRSEKLAAVGHGLVHGFTDREGGASRGRYGTLNMGSKWGDEPGAVLENLRRVGEAAGFDPSRLRLVKQVHGREVVHASALRDDSTADAIVCTRDEGLVVGVLTADCVPVLICDRAGTIAAAVHSGWRGTVAGIVPAAIEALRGHAAPEDLVAAIGPCIELPAFEVGPEVAAQFDDDLVDRSHAKPHIDLVAAVRRQLVGAGVLPENVDRVGGCTHANADRWYSYRRDGSGIGQMLAFIGWTR
jgi:YfiH family protein